MSRPKGSRNLRDLGDSPERIQKCLNCSYPECNNCFYNGPRTRAKHREKTNLTYYTAKADLIKYLGMGMNGAEIAKILDVDQSTVNRWRRKLRAESCV